jgi:hypothetical protein
MFPSQELYLRKNFIPDPPQDESKQKKRPAFVKTVPHNKLYNRQFIFYGNMPNSRYDSAIMSMALMNEAVRKSISSLNL